MKEDIFSIFSGQQVIEKSIVINDSYSAIRNKIFHNSALLYSIEVDKYSKLKKVF